MPQTLAVVLFLATAAAARLLTPEEGAARPASRPAAGAKPRPAPTPVPVLAGTVRGPDGRAVDRALVVVQPLAVLRELLVGRTDAAGRFELRLRSAGLHRVRVEAAGLAAATLERVRPGAPLAVSLGKGGAIEGTVRDAASGATLAGVRVEARQEGSTVAAPWEPGAGTVRGLTDARGRFRLEGLPAGRHTVSAGARGYGRAERRAVSAGSRVDLLLVPGASLAGSVYDAAGTPIAGAVVRAEPEVPFFGIRERQAEPTSSTGRFELPGLEPGTYRVMVRQHEYAPAWVEGVRAALDAETTVDVRLERGAAVVGRLLGGDDLPRPGRVSLQESGGIVAPAAVTELLRAEAGPDGRFRLASLPPGSHVLAVRAPGHAPRRVDVEVGRAGEPVDVGDVVLERGLAIQGRVRDRTGTPITDGTVQAFARGSAGTMPPAAQLEADGRFVLGGLTPGAHNVSVSAVGYGDHEQLVQAGAEVEFVLDRAGAVAGSVVDEAGQPVQSFSVLARPVREPGGFTRARHSESLASADGRFVLDDLAPGRYVVEVSAPEHASGVVPDVTVTAGATVEVGRVRLGEGGTVRGTVADSSGAPVAGASVSLAATGRFGRFGSRTQAVTDMGGAFELKGVPRGAAELSARHPSYAEGRAGPVEVDPARGPAEVRIVLGAGGRVEGRVRRRDGSGVGGIVAQVTRAGAGMSIPGGTMTTTSDDGTFIAEHVPAGRVNVTLLVGGQGRYQSGPRRELDVREGETATIEFVMSEILVTGHVTRSGRPGSGLRVHVRGGSEYEVFLSYGPPPIAAASPGPQRGTAVTREDGSFELIVDQPGEYDFNASTLDGAVHLAPRRVQIPDADTANVDLAYSGVPVTGVVVDRETEQPVAEALVFAASNSGARPSGASAGGSATSGADGRFQLELEPGDYRLLLRAPGQGYSLESLPLAVPNGGISDVRVALSRGQAITGRVVDASGRPAGAVWVGARPSEERQEFGGGGTQSLPDGSFEIAGLAAGAYTVVAQSSLGYFALQPRVSAGQADLKLVLRRGGRVSLRVRGPDGAPAEGAFARVQAVDGMPAMLMVGPITAADGTGELAVPTGRVKLRVARQNLEATTTVDVPEGATVPVEVVLSPTPAR